MCDCGKPHRIVNLWISLYLMLSLIHQDWHAFGETRNCAVYSSSGEQQWKKSNQLSLKNTFMENKQTKQTGKKWIKPGVDCHRYRMNLAFEWVKEFSKSENKLCSGVLLL